MVAAVLCFALSAAAGCTSAEHRQATETAAMHSAEPTVTAAAPGDFLEIDGQRAHRVYIPAIDALTIYAMTDTWLYRREDSEWISTQTNDDGRRLLADPHLEGRLYRGDRPPCFAETDEQFEFAVSDDGGASWRPEPGGVNIRPLTVDESIPDVLYGSNCGLSISTDGGETWREFFRSVRYSVIDLVTVDERLLVLETSPTGYSQVRQIDIATPDDPELAGTLLESNRAFSIDGEENRIVVGGVGGVNVSLDGGNTWVMSREGMEESTREPDMTLPPTVLETATPEFGVLAVLIDPTHSERIFAGTVRGLFISQDNGATWDRYSAVGLNARIMDIQLGAEGSDIYATTSEGVIIVPNP